jgi:hypothetical protein
VAIQLCVCFNDQGLHHSQPPSMPVFVMLVVMMMMSQPVNRGKPRSLGGHLTSCRGCLTSCRGCLTSCRGCLTSCRGCLTSCRGRSACLARGLLLAHQLATGAGAVLWLVALPVAVRRGTLDAAMGEHGGADGVALRLGAGHRASRASTLLALLRRALDLALGLVALGLARLLRHGSAGRLAARLLAHRRAHLVANGGRAFPLALGVAIGRQLLRRSHSQHGKP